MTDVWVCANCKSINRMRDTRCYSCGQRQEEVAVVDATTPNVRLAEATAHRTVRGYESSAPFAIAAGILIIVVAAMGLWLLVESLRGMDVLREAFVQAVVTGDEAALDPLLAEQQRLASPSVVAAPPAALRRARVRAVAEPRPPQHSRPRWRHARLGPVEGAALPADPDREPRAGAGHGPGRAVPARSAGRRAGHGVPRLDRVRRQLDRRHRRRGHHRVGVRGRGPQRPDGRGRSATRSARCSTRR